MHVLRRCALLVSTLSGALFLWKQLCGRVSESDHQVPQTGNKAPQSRASRGSRLPGDDSIPQHELKALQAFLRRVYQWRGWAGGLFHVTQAWHAVETAACTVQGGSWQQQFSGSQLTDANCDALIKLIDEQFCGSKLLRRMASAASKAAAAAAAAGAAVGVQSRVLQGSPKEDHPHGELQQRRSCDALQTEGSPSGADLESNVGCSRRRISGPSCTPCSSQQGQAVANAGAPDSSDEACSASAPHRKLRCRVVQIWDAQWLAYFDTRCNVIFINCWRWAKDVSPDTPMNCEGVVCTNRLQLLMHTLGHELVHAAVFHLFPEIDESSPAYVVDSRHGPIFHLLNKQMFGHSSDALEYVHALPSRRV